MFDKALFNLPGIKGILAALGLLAALKAAAVLGEAFALAYAVDQLWHGLPIETQTPPIAVFFACLFGKQAVSALEDALLSRYAARQSERLRRLLLEQALTGQAGWVRSHGTARVTTATLEGVDQVENYLKVILPKVMEAGLILPATLLATFILDWPSGIILLAVLPVIVFYMIMLGRMAQDRAARQYRTYQRLSNHFVDTLRGLPVLKALGASKRHTKQVFQASEDFREATVATLRVATLSSVVLDLLATLGVAAVAIILGFRLVVGALPLFVGLAALILAPEYFAPLREFAGDFHASLDGRNALADIMALVGPEAEKEGSAPATPPQAALATWNGDSSLDLTGIGFTYPPDEEGETGHAALRDVGFTARGFTRIGIVGASGSGKSTLANLLGGFIQPENGAMKINGDAVPGNTLASDAWQRQLLYIPQDPHLFHATLRDNIAFYTPQATPEQVEQAARVVGLAPLLAELPEGLDTVIGTGGRELSGGQAHRIALARALLDSSRRILIFDEPTAHLDIETELELKERMLPLMEGRLVFFATHRLHWLDNMDYVLVMEEGRIVRQGTPASLGFTALAAETGPSAPAATAPAAEALNVSTGHDEPEKPHETLHTTAADTWVRPYFSRYRKTLFTALGLGIAAAAFAALMMLTSGYLISATGEATGSILFYYLPIALVQVFGIGKPLLRYFERLQSHDWVFRMTSSLRVRLYKALEQQALKPGRRSAGEVLGLVTEDIGHIQNLYLRTVFPLVIAWTIALLALLALAGASPAFAAALLLPLALAAVAAPVAAYRCNRTRIQRHKDMKNRLYDDVTDNLLGASDWVFSGRGASCLETQLAAAGETHALQDATNRYERLNGLAVCAVLGGIACAILWWAAVRFGGPVGGSANWIAACVLGFLPLIETFMPLAGAAIQANVHRDSITRLNCFPNVDDSLPPDTEGTPKQAGTQPAHAGIALRGLSYAYPGSHRLVLDGVDLSIPAGQRLAVLGRSGSGKSTLVSLIRGDVSPTAGTAQLGGVATAELGDAAAAHLGMVQQDAYLFNAPLRDNITIGNPAATDDEIWDVLERVGLTPLARRLPQQLDTMVDEAGMRFSGGERHRLALARVLLTHTPIIALDEPTVGLDPRTEQDVLDTVLETTQGRTLIMITHHLQGVERFDRVVFLEDGRLELDGTPDELARTSKRYQKLLAFDRGN